MSWSVPGIGEVVARTWATALDDMTRFATAQALCSGTGLTPSAYASGAAGRRGPLSRQGSSRVRHLLVAPAWRALPNDAVRQTMCERMAATRYRGHCPTAQRAEACLFAPGHHVDGGDVGLWWVYQVTHSALVLGGVGFAGQIPALLLVPFAGALVDRWDRHRVLVVTQTLAMLQAFALAWLVLADVATLGQIVGLSVLLGVINAVDMPTRQALVVDLVDRHEDLSNALALNSVMTNGARLAGPALAGLMIVSLGEGRCFLLNGLSYLAILAAVVAMRLPPHPSAPPGASLLAEAYAGVRYAWGFAPIRAILLLVSAANALEMPYQVLLPVFATDVLHGDAHTLGMLTAASGVGAIIGALYMASRDSVLGLGRVLVWSTGLFGLGLVGLSWARHEAVAILALVGASGEMLVLSTASNTVLQTMVDEEQRGRVMSFYTMAFLGTTPIGSLIAGSVATHIGAPQTVRLGGIGCLLGALVFARHLPALREMVRPIYTHLGLIQAATLRTQTAIDACLHGHH